MKLSEAIRLGAMLKPQGFGLLNDGDATCALGAAHHAAGIIVYDDQVKASIHALRRWPVLGVKTNMPIAGYRQCLCRVDTMIVTLNDEERWTREQIAEWVEGVEATHEIGQPASTNAVDPIAHDQLVLTPRA